MIRFAWRDFRTYAIVALGTLLIAAVILAITGANLTHLYNTTVANCKANNNCSIAASVFLSTDEQLQTALDVLMIALPGLLGIFWGAPLIAHELEAGTHRLAWTQSVTRARWLAIKIGVVGLGSLLVTGCLSLLVSWWFSPIDRTNMNIFGSFDQRDIVPIGYTAFAFALGVTSGTIFRRTLPAMATTCAGFVAIRLAVWEWVRPNLMAPLHKTVPDTVIGSLASGQNLRALLYPPNAWLISDQTISGAGHVIGQNGFVGTGFNLTPGAGGHGLTIQGAGTCTDITIPSLPTAPGPFLQKCLDELHIRDALTYQLGDRYWPFQCYELAIFLVLSLSLVGLCFWWILHRVN